MRRVVSSLLIAVIAASCSDSPTSLHRSSLRLALAPQFSAKAQKIYRSLSAFAVTLDNVHVVVRVETSGTAGPVLKDTTIAFPATADQVTINLEVPIQGAQQDLVATVELRAATTAYFSGTQDFAAKQGETTTAPEPVQLNYVGPGATAASIAVTPQPAIIAPLTSVQFTALVLDATEHSVTGLPLTWSTGDSTIATVSQSGVVTSTGKLGLTTLTVSGLNGAIGVAQLSVQPVAKLTVTAGNNQTGIAGAALSTKLQVQATDANGNAVIGATINFAAAAGGGASVSPASGTTDATGAASTTITLGTVVGSYAFTATVAGSPNVTVRAAASATAAAAAALGSLGGSSQIDTVLATFGKPLSVKITDAFGNPVSQQAVDFQVTSGQALLVAVPGTASQPLVHTTTDNTGTAQVTLVAGTVAGAVVVTATAPQTSIAPVTFSATLNPGAPTLLSVIRQPSAAAQATVPLGIQPKVRVTDSYGNAVAVAGLQILVVPTFDCGQTGCERRTPPRNAPPALTRNGTTTTRRLTPTAPISTSRLTVPTTISKTRSVSDTFPQGIGGNTTAVTDANGIATFSNLSLDLSVGSWLMEFVDTTATQGLAAAISNSIAVSPGPIASIIAWGVPDTSFVFATVDTLFPSVRVIDKVGNGIPGVPVSWSADAFSLLDSAKTTTTTDANGFAAPGRWIFAFGNTQSFSIVATPTPANIENSPLTLSAFIELIGRVVPPKVPSAP